MEATENCPQQHPNFNTNSWNTQIYVPFIKLFFFGYLQFYDINLLCSDLLLC